MVGYTGISGTGSPSSTRRRRGAPRRVPLAVALLFFVGGCVVGGPTGEPDASRDAPLGADVHDAGIDTARDAPPACSTGAARCGVEGREVCVFIDGAVVWRPLPCDRYEVCDEGRCGIPEGLDLAGLASAPDWTHPDVGTTWSGDTSPGPDAFPTGLVLVNPFGERLDGIVWSSGGSVYSMLEPRSTTLVLTPWWTPLSQVSDAGAVALPRSYWEPTYPLQAWETRSLVPIAVWVGSPGRPVNVLDPRCVGSSPPLECFARSFETSLVSGESGTTFVVGSLPAAAHYDACADELVVRGLPFVGVTHASGTNSVEVLSSARFGAGEPPTVPITDSEPPEAIEPGGTERAVLYPTGAWQLVVAPPRTLEECVPLPSTECVRPCTARALDLSGTRITTTRRSVVTIGHTCASDSTDGACGYALETVPPITALGASHHIPGPASFEAGEVLVHLVANAPGTVVTTPGGTRTLGAGEAFSFASAGDTFVEASGPLLVMRYSHRAGTSALAATLVRADEARARQHLLPGGSGVHALVVLARTDVLRVDGVEVSGARRAFAGAELDVVEVELDETSSLHELETTSPSHVFVAWVPAHPHLLAISRGARR